MAEQPDPAAGVAELLAAPTRLIGVRHHSPTLARVLPELLAAARPDAIVLEAPPELTAWIDWLVDPAAVPPLAFAVVRADGQLGFYPFADVSPELATVRWAVAHGVPLVEVPGVGAEPESVRRAGLAFGWAYRSGDDLDPRTAAREASMRTGIRQALVDHGPCVVAVTGAWHSPALAGDPAATEAADAALLARWATVAATTCLVPWTAAQLDSRSGYPAGIRDPQWQTEVLQHGADPAALADRTTALLTRMAAGIRAQGFPAGPGEAAEAARVARDLAAIRELPAPGRDELLEACTTVFAHGDVLGRGRMVARVARDVLIGEARGRLAPGTPVSGLVASFEADRAALRLPGPETPERELRLEPLRADQAKELFLQRCVAARITYAESLGTVGVGGAQAVTSGWRVRHTATTEATLAAAGLRGVTIAQAAAARLDEPFTGAEPPALATVVTHLRAAARCGLATSFARWLAEAATRLPAEADVRHLTAGLDALTTIADGLISGTTEQGFAELADRIGATRAEVAQAAVAQVAGLAGSDDADDARAVGELVALVDGELGVRLRSELRHLTRDGAPLMAGAAAAVLWRHGEGDDDRGGLATVGERIRGSATAEARRGLTRWLVGVFAVSPDLTTSDEEFAAALAHGVAALPDPVFLTRLPALRGGFDVLSAAERERTLTTLTQLTGDHVSPAADVDADTLAVWAAEDLATADRLAALGLADASFTPATR